MQVVFLVPTPWYGPRRTGLKTVVIGAESMLEVMAVWVEVGAETAAAVAVPARWLVEADARTAAAEWAAKFGAAVGLARSWVVAVVAAGRADAAACSDVPGLNNLFETRARSPPGFPAYVLPPGTQNHGQSFVGRCTNDWPPRSPLWRGSETYRH